MAHNYPISETHYLRMKPNTHAQETRTLRGGHRQERKDQSKRVRHLPGGHEAKAKTASKVIAWGKHHTVAHPALQWERDTLLENLFKTQDQFTAWQNVNKYVLPTHSKKAYTNAKNRHRGGMMAILQDHIAVLKNRLLLLDEQISPIHEPALPHRND